MWYALMAIPVTWLWNDVVVSVTGLLPLLWAWTASGFADPNPSSRWPIPASAAPMHWTRSARSDAQSVRRPLEPWRHWAQAVPTAFLARGCRAVNHPMDRPRAGLPSLCGFLGSSFRRSLPLPSPVRARSRCCRTTCVYPR